MTNSRASQSQVFKKVVTTADQAVNNSESVVNHSTLFALLKINKTYAYEYVLLVNSSSVADIALDFTLPSGATGLRNNGALGIIPTTLTDITTAVNLACDGTNQIIVLKGRVIMSSTGGNLQLQFAQDTAEVSDTKILIGSSLIVYEST